jgi:signal transduction histidine kinase
MSGLRKANQRAATIITTLRNMFGSGRKTITTFDFNDLVRDVVLLCQSSLQRQSIELQVQLYPLALHITGDKSQLQQVLLNLITNASEAFQASFQGVKHIAVKTHLEDKHIVLSVTDNGSGIAPDIQTMVFELLRTSKDTGMGIGLWLSKTIVESHQGNIHFNTALGEGTSFKVALPATTEALYF